MMNASGAVQLERTESEAELAYHLQGDASLNTQEALARRCCVVEALAAYPGSGNLVTGKLRGIHSALSYRETFL